jgi:hypothetical protein
MWKLSFLTRCLWIAALGYERGDRKAAGYCTLGWARTLTASAEEGRRIALKAIHPPPIAISNAPAGCVSRLPPVVTIPSKAPKR